MQSYSSCDWIDEIFKYTTMKQRRLSVQLSQSVISADLSSRPLTDWQFYIGARVDVQVQIFASHPLCIAWNKNFTTSPATGYVYKPTAQGLANISLLWTTCYYFTYLCHVQGQFMSAAADHGKMKVKVSTDSVGFDLTLIKIEWLVICLFIASRLIKLINKVLKIQFVSIVLTLVSTSKK